MGYLEEKRMDLDRLESLYKTNVKERVRWIEPDMSLIGDLVKEYERRGKYEEIVKVYYEINDWLGLYDFTRRMVFDLKCPIKWDVPKDKQEFVNLPENVWGHLMKRVGGFFIGDTRVSLHRINDTRGLYTDFINELIKWIYINKYDDKNNEDVRSYILKIVDKRDARGDRSGLIGGTPIFRDMQTLHVFKQTQNVGVLQQVLKRHFTVEDLSEVVLRYYFGYLQDI
jgi:hypothetical protein